MENHKLEELCRVCLSPNDKMLPLNSCWDDSSVDKNSPSIANILERVMSVKIQSTKYPNRICRNCKKDLEISYRIYCVFHRSQDLLNKSHNIKGGNNSNIKRTEARKEPVELVIDGKTFSLHDILIVEEEPPDETIFEGFLKNLGQTVSAHFVNNEMNNRSEKVLREPENFEEIRIVVINEPEDNKDMDGSETKLTEGDGKCNSKNIEIMEDESQNIDSMHIIDNRCNKTLQQCEIGDQIAGDYSCTINQGIALVSESSNKTNQSQPNVACTTNKSNQLIQEATSETQILSKPDTESSKEIQANRWTKYICSFCGQVASPARRFKNGQIACEPCNLLVLDCEYCDFTTDSRIKYVGHIETHSGSQLFKCDRCDKKFVSKSSLDIHTRNRHNVNIYLCTICGRLVRDNSGFLYHMRTHTNDFKFCCSHCGQKFKIRSHLTRHERTHRGFRPFKCTHCGKAFFTSAENRRHELVHLAKKPLKCKYCNAVFSRRDHRKLHHMTHSGPHVCVYCSKTFIEMSCLQDHLNCKHKNELVT